MALVSTQKLAAYSTSARGKLTLPQHVVGKIRMLFPPALRNAGKAELIMFLEDPNEGSLPFVVTASLQKLRKKGGNCVRVVLLESGWMPIVRKLQLEKGDTVRVSLLNKMPWTYSIDVERVPEAGQIDADAMDEDVVPEEAPRRIIFDLNEPAPLDMDPNQPNQQGRMMFDFDLNEPAHPDMETNRNDED
ncbi:hypothetical protein SLEP1_g35460 [Rubroshorea leprosula]|uniref:Uncharacterized protein n=1 Tax=Rubroshorea leprosula TaxID=152421 RepID=A0AAV5KNJ1_9ROSI|nr:hypothetical protein SLEP1_g35460 [Rubroshorea leprosula]